MYSWLQVCLDVMDPLKTQDILYYIIFILYIVIPDSKVPLHQVLLDFLSLIVSGYRHRKSVGYSDVVWILTELNRYLGFLLLN